MSQGREKWIFSGKLTIILKNGIMCLPDELICTMAAFLDVPSLLRMRFVSKRFRQIMSRNEAGWTDHCTRLWRDKILVSAVAKSHSHAMTAYRISVEDAKTRDHITVDELCYDLSPQKGTIFSFRFKECAGVEWTGADPWWSHRQARQIVLLSDGTVKRYIPYTSQDPKLLTATEFSMVDDGILVDLFGPMSWRFVIQPMDMPSRPLGSYIRFRVAGRDVPTYVVRRSPTNNLGFIMESCWGVYASFELPPRRSTRELRLRRTPNGGRWLPIDDSDADSDNEDEQDEKDSLLKDDSAFIITNEVQWREALLYNFGARELPEGDGAAEEFDRTWGERLLHLVQG
jgi:hypothetical protein